MSTLLALLAPSQLALANLTYGDPINVPLAAGGRGDAVYSYARGFNAALQLGARLVELPDTVIPVPIGDVRAGWLHHRRRLDGQIERIAGGAP